MTWTPETVAELERLVVAGHTSNEVERLMPGIGRNAIVSKVRRLPVEWATPQVGGRDRISLSAEKRRQIVDLLGTGMSIDRVAVAVHASPTTVKAIRAGRTTSRPPVVPVPVVVQEVRPVVVRDPVPTPVRAVSNVVALPVSGVRTCQFIEGSGRPWTTCGERVAWLGCSWCGSHARTVFARHPMIADAAD